jgi:hypothetical protein
LRRYRKGQGFLPAIQGNRRTAGHRPDYRHVRKRHDRHSRVPAGSGEAHELDALRASLSKLQARLSVTEDDDELDALVAERKSLKARIEGFEVIPDSFDYAPTGQMVAGMWSGDDTVKRNMVKAVKDSWGLALAEHEGQWGIKIGTDFRDVSSADGIVDLGNGLCFRRDMR